VARPRRRQLGHAGRASPCDRPQQRCACALARTGALSPIHEIEHLLRLEWDVDSAAAILVGANAAAELWIAITGQTKVSAREIELSARRRGIPHPVRLFRLPVIPRTANGKVNREQLRILMQQSMNPAAALRPAI
jgi:acyl-coenzyme A synthetase/AMP-(fatty) acid ligase